MQPQENAAIEMIAQTHLHDPDMMSIIHTLLSSRAVTNLRQRIVICKVTKMSLNPTSRQPCYTHPAIVHLAASSSF